MMRCATSRLPAPGSTSGTRSRRRRNIRCAVRQCAGESAHRGCYQGSPRQHGQDRRRADPRRARRQAPAAHGHPEVWPAYAKRFERVWFCAEIARLAPQPTEKSECPTEPRYVRDLTRSLKGRRRDAVGSGRRILVVGAARDVRRRDRSVSNGRAMSLLFAREARTWLWRIYTCERGRHGTRIAAEGRHAFSIEADIAREADVVRMIDEATDGLGGLDGMVLDAASASVHSALMVSTSRSGTIRLRQSDPPDAVCHKALKNIADGASIVFISSIAGLLRLAADCL